MNTKEYLDLVEKEMKDLLEVLRAKNSDYTGGSQDPFSNFRVTEKLGLSSAETGILIRMVDKIQRVKSFLAKGKLEVKNEAVEDALRDIIGYSFIMLGMLSERKPKEEVPANTVTDLTKLSIQQPFIPPQFNKYGKSGAV